MAKIVLFASKDCNFYNFRREMILKLKEYGHDIVLSCPSGDKISYFTERGCRFIPHNMDRRGTNIFADFNLIKNYYKIISEEKPDIVLTYTGKSSVYGGLVCRWLKIPCIINNAGLLDTKYYSFIVKFALDNLYRIGFRKASCMMFQNSQERDYISRILGDNIHYRDLPGSGVNLDYFDNKPLPPKDAPIIINYVGRIVNIKGIEEFLECAEAIKLKYSTVIFRIFGDYDDEKYKNRVHELEDKGVVRYYGVQRDMRPYIEEAWAVIHASYYEGMTNVVLEHSAMGRICIGSDIPGVKEGIEDNVSGFLFPVRNVNSLIASVEKFLLLPYEKKVEMGYLARKKMEREFDRNIVTNIYLEEINKILKNK